MAQARPAKSGAKRSAKGATTSSGPSVAFTAEERAAMKEHAKELKAGQPDGETAVLEKIAEMSDADRVLAERIHALVTAAAPELTPRTWYGSPAYAKNGKLICFFQPASKFKARYATLGFNDDAMLDDGTMWATSFALTQLTEANEAKITELVKKAAS